MARSKRASASESADESEIKRTKVATEEYEVMLGGEMYVNVDMLFKCAELHSYFTSIYKRSVKNFIEKEGLSAVFVHNDDVKKGLLNVKAEYASKSDARLVKKDERIVSIIATAKENSLPFAPAVIEDEDLTFFKYEKNKSYHVEMRGERTLEGIRFKAKDVATVFENPRLTDTIVDERKSYRESIDYVWFAMPKVVSGVIKQRKSSAPSGQGHSRKSDTSDQEHFYKSDTPLQEQRNHSFQRTSTKEVFLTFSGLMHALHNTRSPVAGKFRGWVYKLVFTLAYGTKDQKKDMVKELCKIDKTFLQAFMKLVPNNLACIYLVDTTDRVGDAKVYKFGRPSKMKDRFYDHSSTFGDGTLLDTIIFVPADALGEAEASLKNSVFVDARYIYEEVEEFDTLNDAERKATELNDAKRKATELIKLTNEDRTAVRMIMRTIADKYNGSMTIQASKHDEEIKDLKTAHKFELDDLEHEHKTRLDKLKHKHKIKASDLKHEHKTEVDGLKHKHKINLDDLKSTYELSVKDLKCVIAVFKKQMETVDERMRTAELRYEKQLEIEKLRLEKQMESEKQRLEIEKQRLEIARLKAAAEVNLKNNQIEALQRTTDAQNARIRELEALQQTNNAQSARIRELEELNRRLSKRFSEEEDRP